MALVAKAEFTDHAETVAAALDAIGAGGRLPQKGLIIIKPNLTMARPPPVTTDARTAAAVAMYCMKRTGAEVAIGEGCGDGVTTDVFEACGYTDVARRLGIRLIDFNADHAVRLEDASALQLREFYMPQTCLDAFIISVPVLKDHSFTVTTISMKNMFGLAPAPYYRGTWNKSALHRPSTHLSVVDVCRYRKPDLCVVDAVTALTGMHLEGTPMKLNLVLASYDCVAVDAVGSELLGHNPRRIPYLTKAHGLLGDMEDVEIREVR